MNQILRRQTSRSHYGSKVPAVTITVFKYRNKIGKIVVKAVPNPLWNYKRERWWFYKIISKSFLHLWLITRFVTRVTRRVSLVEQEMFTLPHHLSSPPVFSEVLVARSLVFCAMFCRSLFVLFCFFWSLYYLSFFDLRLLISIYVSSNFSCLTCNR